VIGHASGHRRGDFDGLMDAAEVVVHEVERHSRGQILDLLGKALVSRVKRRMLIRIVRLARSA
jgi:hypothetical protein